MPGKFTLSTGRIIKTQFQTAEDAMAAGITLKEKYPVVRVQIYDAVERSYAPVELTKRAVKSTDE